jgi:transcriptional regulator with XRE-family HTH domain
MTQRHLALAVGVSRGYIAKVERGRANPTLGVVERISAALQLEAELVLRAPVVVGDRRQQDLVHARCSGYVDRRLRGAGWLTSREVEIVHARSHGWIDILAFDPGTGRVLIVEIKTRLDDLGSIERQLGWYERSAFDVARQLGWHARRIVSWLLLLASEEDDAAVRANREVIARVFPTRARAMTTWMADGGATLNGRGLALVDPASRRRDWLIRLRLDGRRSAAPYVGYADAARRMAR